jgi:hypothetical protein
MEGSEAVYYAVNASGPKLDLLDRTPRGRVATAGAYKHFGLAFGKERDRDETSRLF